MTEAPRKPRTKAQPGGMIVAAAQEFVRELDRCPAALEQDINKTFNVCHGLTVTEFAEMVRLFSRLAEQATQRPDAL